MQAPVQQSRRIPTVSADYVAINAVVQPIRRLPKWILGIGMGFGTLVPLIAFIAEAPPLVILVAALIGIGFGMIGYIAVFNLLQKIKADLRSGHKIEVIGLLEHAYTRHNKGNDDGAAGASYHWRIGGDEFVLTQELFMKAAEGQQVRLCYLESSKLTFSAAPYWEELQ